MMGTKYFYATLIHERSSHVKSQKNHWSNLNKICNTDGLLEPPSNGVADSVYRKKDDSRPFSLKVEFPLYKYIDKKDNCIPSNAYITDIVFQVQLKTNGNFDVPCPMGVFTLYGAPTTLTTNYNTNWRWKEGMYHYIPSGKIQSSWDTVYYRMNENIFQKYYNVNKLYDSRFGLILYFQRANKYSKNEHPVSIKSVRVMVSYEVPSYKLFFNNNELNTVNNPQFIDCGEEYVLNVDCINDSKATDTPQKINVKLPSNTEVVRYTGDYDTVTNTWTVNGKSREHNKLMLVLKTWNSGEQTITFHKNDIVKADYHIFAKANLDDRYSVKCSAPDMHKGFKSTISFNAIARSDDGNFNIPVDIKLKEGQWSNYIGKWELITESDSISIDWTNTKQQPDSTTNSINIAFNIPPDTTCNLYFQYHITPLTQGQHECIVQGYKLPFFVDKQYKYIGTNNPAYKEDECYFFINPAYSISNRSNVITTGQIHSPILPVGCVSNQLEIRESNITVDYNKPVSHIGAIPLYKFKNIDPKSTISNKLVQQNSLKKKYMGKEMDVEEDISLKILIHPKDSATLQGYAKLDAPTPINVDPLCFEGDPLNHRGWVEITKVTLSQRNKLYYEAEVEVNYLTHDINSSFEIIKGDKPNILDLPELLDTVCEMGDNLSESEIFTVDTDGDFYFDENDIDEDGNITIGDVDDNNTINLHSGQSFKIKSIQLGDVFEVAFSWMSESSMYDVSRIIRVMDNVTGNPVMEYEYFNVYYDVGEQVFKCDSVLRTWNDDGEIVPENSNGISLLTENDEDKGDMGYFGSAFYVKVNQNKLHIVDEGISGNEFLSDKINLAKGDYYIEFEFKNNNDDLSSNVAVSTLFNIECSMNVDDVIYKDYLNNLVVSPFPVPHKEVVFTRDSEDGSLYYYHDEGTPFIFKVDPFYQFKTGCCLLSYDGVYLFDLDNSHVRFYMSNGLVRLGVNKSTGRLYLDKFDVFSGVWFTVGYLRLVGNVRFELVSLSADKVVVRAGNTSFTIWRGHPFIMIEHPDNSILFEDNFKYIYADRINGIIEPTPTIFNLLNTENLLPQSIGGKKLKTENITTIEEKITIIPITDITITGDGTVREWASATITANINEFDTTNGTLYFIVNGEIITEKHTSSCTLPIPETDEENKYFFTKTGTNIVQLIYTDNERIGISEKITVNVEQQEVPEDEQPEKETITGNYNLELYNFPKKVKYCDHQPISFLLTKNGHLINSKENLRPVDVLFPDNSITSGNVVNGIVSVPNRCGENVGKLPRKCSITAQFTFKKEIDGKETKIAVVKKTGTLTMEKATPYFVESSVGKYILKGASEQGDIGIKNAKIIYKVGGIANKKTTTTNKDGMFKVNMHNAMSITLMYAGNNIYNSCKKIFKYPIVK